MDEVANNLVDGIDAMLQEDEEAGRLARLLEKKVPRRQYNLHDLGKFLRPLTADEYDELQKRLWEIRSRSPQGKTDWRMVVMQVWSRLAEWEYSLNDPKCHERLANDLYDLVMAHEEELGELALEEMKSEDQG